MNGTIIRLNEHFGPTIQGEGPTAGTPCAFIRFGLCNLSCKWCDTPYTWDWQGRNGVAFDKAAEVHPTPLSSIDAWLDTLTVGTIVLSGGEPLVQRTAHHDLCVRLRERRFRVETETNGTLLPDPVEGCRWNVSPKLAGSGVPAADRVRPEVLEWFADQALCAFKFVVCDEADVVEAVALCERAGMPMGRVWLMAEGRTRAEQLEAMPRVAQWCVDVGANLSPRLHVLLWGDERGR
jgi:7-carboxy-7-deazaguanine synthase